MRNLFYRYLIVFIVGLVIVKSTGSYEYATTGIVVTSFILIVINIINNRKK